MILKLQYTQIINKSLFTEIHESFIGKERSYLIGDINFQQLIKSDFWNNKHVSIIANPAFTSKSESNEA